MGICMCDNRPSDIYTISITEELEQYKIKLFNRFKINPFHNYTAKRQSELSYDFLQKPANENRLSNFLESLKSFDSLDIQLILQTYINSKRYDITDHKFFMILMFVLSNTKNNSETKKEFGRFFIKESENTAGRIDINKLKKIVKHTIKISVNIILNYILLRIFLDSKVDLVKYIQDNEIQMKKYNSLFVKITKLLKKETVYKRIIEKWENFLLAPYIFASYSSNVNISEYSQEVKEEMVRHFVTLFDGKEIIESLFNSNIIIEEETTI
jgi:hypothetical protein